MVANAHPGFVTAVVFDAAGETVLSASVDGAVNVWDVGMGALRIRQLRVSSDGRYVASASQDGTGR